MGEMKSAFEIAMEKVARLDKPSEEEASRWKYAPEGKRLAADYLKDDVNLLAELGKFDERERTYVVEGIEEVLVSNVGLPANDAVRRNNKKAMEALKSIKSDKAATENVFSKMRRVFEHYENEGQQQKKQAYEMLKQNLQMKIQQAMQQQGMSPPARLNVEQQPQFQEEWRRTQAHLDSQYIRLLDEYKEELVQIR